MKVTCCRCGETYDYEYGSICMQKTIELGEGNIVDIIKCPHCGLSHFVIWIKKLSPEEWAVVRSMVMGVKETT